jgi:tetratricopeptide (TPR) repeat protein
MRVTLNPFYIKLFSILLISCVGILAYSNIFHCSFHFDDIWLITDNFVIRSISNLQNIWNFLPCRFIFYLSLALNYHFHQLDVFGYHVVNLTIHLVSAILVWWLVLLTFSTPAMKEGTIEKSAIERKSFHKFNRTLPILKTLQKSTIIGHTNLIALFVGLIFVSHPIQTQGVTYIMQRAASMATLFYVASLCFYVKSRLLTGHSPLLGRIYYMGSFITTIIAMFTKEITITLPLMILLYEFSFLRTKKSLDWKCLVPFLLTLFIIPVTMLLTKAGNAISTQEMQRALEGSTEISTMQYILTQFKVIVTYIRLIFLPLNQNLDYDYPISHSIVELPTLFSFLFLIVIFFSAVRLFSKYRLVSFSIFWFFLTLLPESSLFPIKDVIYEHRLYLPLVGYSMFLVSGIYYLFGKNTIITMGIVLTMIVGCNSVLTYQRNKVWKDEFTLWDDSVRKSPHKARPYNNRGKAYDDQGNLPQAIADYSKAIEINPNYADAYCNRGNIYNKLGNFTQAMFDYNKAIEINPDYELAYNNRGSVYEKQDNLTQALSDYNKTIELNPKLAEAYNNRGNVYDKQGSFPQALSDYTKAIEINPKFAMAYANLGDVYIKQGNLSQAMADYTKAIEINPNFAEAYSNRGIVYYDQGNVSQAISDFTKAIEINPKFAKAYNNRGLAYDKQGNFNQAISDYAKAIEINSKYTEAYNNRGGAYSQQGNLSQAISDFNKAIELNPNYGDAYSDRGGTYAEQNNLSQAILDLSKAIKIKPNLVEAYIDRGLVYIKQGNFTKAFSDFNKIIAINPTFAEAYEGRAYAYLGTKEYEKAWADVHKAEALGYKLDKEDLEFLEKLKKASGRDK